jgi:very-short-patch-repair endonuclease
MTAGRDRSDGAAGCAADGAADGAADRAADRAAPWQAQDLAVLGRLRRFAAGRAQGLPGFAVLAGPVARSLTLWQAWQAERGAAAILTGHSGREDVIRACLAGMLAGRDLVADIAALLAPHLNRRVDALELAARLARQGLPERTALLRSLEDAPEQPALQPLGARMLAVCESLLADPSGAGLAAEAGTVPLVAALTAGPSSGPLAGPASGPSSGSLPGLLIVEPARRHDAEPTPQAAGSAWLAETAATALHLGELVPGLIVGVAAEQARIDAYLAAGPAAQVAARVRAGLIAVPAPEDMPAGVPADVPAGAPAAAADSGQSDQIAASPELARAAWVRRGLEQEQVATAVLDAFDEAVRLLPRARKEEDDPGSVPDAVLARARSAAERTLYQRLACHPETAGLFELNGRMPFSFGNREAEIDLVCRPLAVAVEVDGYWHFRDEDRVRSDRRKDVLLQSHGFLVVRVLAGDVVARMGEVMTHILDVVRMQRQRRGRGERNEQ